MLRLKLHYIVFFVTVTAVVYFFTGLFVNLDENASFTERNQSLQKFIGKEQEDKELIQFVKSRMHSPSSLPYNLPNPAQKDYAQYNQTAILEKIFKKKQNGFFVEVGAFDGVVFSNSLYWERELQWKGILIEANPDLFQQLLEKHRKSYAISACVSISTKTELMRFHKQGLVGKLVAANSTINDANDITIPCFPIYSILAALGNPTVDFFSLDIEGWELHAIRTIPFDKVDIKVFIIEYFNTAEGFEALEKLMESKGYRSLGKYDVDGIFVKKDMTDV